MTSAKVRNGSLLSRDFRSGQLPRGPRGPEGLAGKSATGSGALGYASRDMYPPGPAVDIGATAVDLVGLGTPAGTAGYAASSGLVKADGPSRLIADAQGVILNAAAARGSAGCKLALVGTDVRALGNYVNANLEPNSGYVPVAVSGGVDVESGTYDVRFQCFSGDPGISFHRGNLTVTVAPR
ncbi:MAG: hypothetical protein H0W96_11160 [Solirubrobacterales bacterium]|nr:hypothetical protein [Solirubrobacterales bacterium]